MCYGFAVGMALYHPLHLEVHHNALLHTNGVEQVTADSEATLDCDKHPFDSDSESDDNY